MSAFWKAGNAFIAASLGWTTTWAIGLLCSAGANLVFRSPDRASLADGFGDLTLTIVCTAIVTLLATVIFIVPYVCLRSSDSILKTPWRLYLEPCLIAATFITGFDIVAGPTAYTLREKVFSPYLVFAVVASLASSFFFLWRIKRRFNATQANSKRRFDNNPSPI